MTPFTEWQTFYEIVGSAAGALTGLQFVAMVLIADIPMRPGESGTEAFSSPSVVHFSGVLLLSASVVIPWASSTPAAVAWSLAGITGLGYSLLTARRMQRQTTYEPVLEDWLFHAILPSCGYAGLAVSAFCVHSHLRDALFGIAGVALLLLVVSIHNAWDNLTYLVTMRRQRANTPS